MPSSHSEQEDAGEGYFASISDLMVGILFIFLLMLAVFASNFATDDKVKEIRELKDRVKALSAEVDDLRHRLQIGEKKVAELTHERDALLKALTDLAEELKSVNVALSDDQGRLERVRSDLLVAIQKGLEGRVQVEIDTRHGILRLSSEGLFDDGVARFTRNGEAKAKALIEEMGRLLPCYSIATTNDLSCSRQPIFETILIEGHTDTRTAYMEGGNWRLSTDRALNFLQLIVGSSPTLSGLQNDSGQPLLGLAGYGDTRRLPDMDGADSRNRRIEIRFLLSSRRDDLPERIKRLEGVLSRLRTLAQAPP